MAGHDLIILSNDRCLTNFLLFHLWRGVCISSCPFSIHWQCEVAASIGGGSSGGCKVPRETQWMLLLPHRDSAASMLLDQLPTWHSNYIQTNHGNSILMYLGRWVPLPVSRCVHWFKSNGMNGVAGLKWSSTRFDERANREKKIINPRWLDASCRINSIKRSSVSSLYHVLAPLAFL